MPLNAYPKRALMDLFFDTPSFVQSCIALLTWLQTCHVTLVYSGGIRCYPIDPFRFVDLGVQCVCVKCTVPMTSGVTESAEYSAHYSTQSFSSKL